MKKSCLQVLKSTGPATNTKTGFTLDLCGVPGQFTNRTSSGLLSVTQRDPIPGLRAPDGTIETNDEQKAQILANHFQTVYTREPSLPEVGLPSDTETAKIE